MKNAFLLLLFGLLSTRCWSQSANPRFTTGNAHSHNDYEQRQPFWNAWHQGFGSIEADIFLVDNKLVVAHNNQEVALGRTLDSLYLNPLLACVRKNNGHAFPDSSRHLQLMIDVKSEARTTLAVLVKKLGQYPALINSPTVTIVISGNRPDPSLFSGFPSWIMFDGELRQDYTNIELSKIAMLSDNFAKYSSWDGNDQLSTADSITIRSYVNKANGLHKKIRFWNAPDNTRSWKILLEMGIDFINTDHIDEFSSFLKLRY